MKRICLLAITIILLAGCSARKSENIPPDIARLKNLTVIPADAKPEFAVKFNRQISFGSTDKVLIGHIDRITVDDSGRVIIASAPNQVIYVFEPNGRYLTHLGRKGKGPGEFQMIYTMKTTSGYLYVYDGTLRRMDVFSLKSLKLYSTINLNKDNWKDIKAIQSSITTDRFFIRRNGDILMGFTSLLAGNEKNWKKPEILKKERYRYYVMDKQGKINSGQLLEQHEQKWTFGSYRGFKVMFHLSIYGKPLIAGTKNGNIFSAWSDDFLIREYNPEGNFMRAIYFPYKNNPLIRADLVKLNNHGFNTPQLHAARTMQLPKTWPALNGIRTDNQNRLWVSTIVKNIKVYQWWVLTPNGKLIARFHWPRSKPIQVIKNGLIYTQETDTSTGISKVVRYKIKLE